MRNTGVRWVWLILVLAVALFLILRLRPPKPGDGDGRPTPGPTDVVVNTPTPTPAAPTPTCVPLSSVTPGVQRVSVGPTACDVKPDCITIQYGRDTVTWTGVGTTETNLSIEFDAPVFSGMGSSSGKYQIPCTGLQCVSGQINPLLPTPPAPTRSKEYKYSQRLYTPNNPNSPPACDGRIIIKW
jgi:hypothetical protein